MATSALDIVRHIVTNRLPIVHHTSGTSVMLFGLLELRHVAPRQYLLSVFQDVEGISASDSENPVVRVLDRRPDVASVVRVLQPYKNLSSFRQSSEWAPV